MRVNELIQRLQSYPPNTTVLLSCDAEGNDYSPLDGLSMTWASEDDRYYTLYAHSPETDEDSLADDEDPDEIAPGGAEEVVVLWPI